MAAMEEVPILTYHSLDDSGSVISTPPVVFRAQMAILRRRGFTAITLGELLVAWGSAEALPARVVVLTFDDGFENLMEHAMPVLAEHGFRATVFAVPGFCGRTNDWPSQPSGIPRLPLASFAQLRGMAETACEVGAHTVTHPVLDGMPAGAAEREIIDSQTILQDRLGRPVSTFSYPYGSASEASRVVVAGHYAGACSTEMASARPVDDRWFLPRIDAYYVRGPRAFQWFATPPGRLYLCCRRVAREFRAAVTARRLAGSRGIA